MGKLHIQREYGCTYSIEGLSPKEMDSILNAETWDQKRNTLTDLLDKHDNDYQPGHSLGTCWGCGYGIYDIRHVGGHLFVTTGSTCD